MKNKNDYIDEEEKELIETYKKVNLKNSKKPGVKEQKIFKQSAKNFLKNATKMNIRINPYELVKIKECAENEGLKYQTFIKSIIHKYITGRLVEKKYH